MTFITGTFVLLVKRRLSQLFRYLMNIWRVGYVWLATLWHDKFFGWHTGCFVQLLDFSFWNWFYGGSFFRIKGILGNQNQDYLLLAALMFPLVGWSLWQMMVCIDCCFWRHLWLYWQFHIHSNCWNWVFFLLMVNVIITWVECIHLNLAPSIFRGVCAETFTSFFQFIEGVRFLCS